MAISYCSAPMPMRSAQLDKHLNELLATKVGISQTCQRGIGIM
jgi:hypothetical protein